MLWDRGTGMYAPALSGGFFVTLVRVLATAALAACVLAAPALADGDPSDAATSPEPGADLSVEKSAPTETSAGGVLTYTLAIQNDGPADATGVVASDSLSPGLTFVSATPSQGTCSETNGMVSCRIGTVDDGAGAQVTILASVGTGLAGRTVTDHAAVGAIEGDPSPSDNADGNDVRVLRRGGPTADLEVHKRVTDGFPRVGNELTYRITVRNNGFDAANDVQLTDTLDQNVQLVSVTTSQGTCTNSLPLQCDLGLVDAEETVVITVVVRLLDSGPLENTASASATETDPRSGNNQASVSVNVAAQETEARLRKRASQRVVRPGDKFNYTIKFRNIGPAPAIGVEICDHVPFRLDILRARGATIQGNDVCWERNFVDVGERVSVKLVVQVPSDAGVGETGQIRNVARASAENVGPIRRAVYNCRLCCPQ